MNFEAISIIHFFAGWTIGWLMGIALTTYFILSGNMKKCFKRNYKKNT